MIITFYVNIVFDRKNEAKDLRKVLCVLLNQQNKILSLKIFVRFKGHGHRDFAVFDQKCFKYLAKSRFGNMKLFLEHREENIKEFLQEKTNYNQFLATSL